MIPKPSIRHRSPPQRIRTSGFQSTCRCSAGRFHVDGERQRSIRFSFVTPFRARADEEPRAPGRSPVIVYDEPPGENAPREDRHVEERADRTHCCDVRGGPDAGAGPPGRRRSRTCAQGDQFPTAQQFASSKQTQQHIATAMKIARNDLVADAKAFCTPTGPQRPALARQAAGLAPEPIGCSSRFACSRICTTWVSATSARGPFQRATASSSSMRLTTPTKVGTYWWVD